MGSDDPDLELLWAKIGGDLNGSFVTNKKRAVQFPEPLPAQP
jgi:hypothetical protein